MFLRHAVEQHDLRAAIIDGEIELLLPAGLLLLLTTQMAQRGFTPTPLSCGHRRAVVPVRRVAAFRGLHVAHTISTHTRQTFRSHPVRIEYGDPHLGGSRHTRRP
jgi:hypothetical protein